jgi:DNA repair protein RadC
MSQIKSSDRPREKLQAKGPAALSDFELLQALIGSGNKQADVSKIAGNTLELFKQHGAGITYQQLQQVTGMGPARITEILAALELSKRYLIDNDQPIIDSPERAVEQLADIRDKKQEYFVVLTLDGANRLITKRIITIGTLTSSLVHPREVFADAITDRAASIIVAHNHPSGSLVASKADIDVTDRLSQAGKLLGIKLVDHIVITKNNYVSLSGHSIDTQSITE